MAAKGILQLVGMGQCRRYERMLDVSDLVQDEPDVDAGVKRCIESTYVNGIDSFFELDNWGLSFYRLLESQG